MTEAAQNAVADRYGTRRTKRLDRRVGWIIGITATVLGAVVIGFGSWQQDTIEVKNIGFTLNDDDADHGVFTATTRFEVNTDPGTRVSCAVEALNTSKATVGWKVVDLPVIDTRSHDVTVRLVTIGRATAVNAAACWPVEQ